MKGKITVLWLSGSAFAAAGIAIGLLVSQPMQTPWVFWPVVCLGMLFAAAAYVATPIDRTDYPADNPPDDGGPIFYGGCKCGVISQHKDCE